MAGLSTEWLRWSTRVLSGSPADVVRSCSKVHGRYIVSAMYLKIVSIEAKSSEGKARTQDER